MVMKAIKIICSKVFQNVPKLGVWFENKPFGNPGQHSDQISLQKNRPKYSQTHFCLN
jgi:hypothetical protein